MSLQVEIPPNYETGRRSNRTRLSKVHARRRHITPSTTQQSKMSNGMYVHSSPPKVVPTNPSVIRQWLRNGDIDKLEQVVLEGHGQKLVGEYSPDSKVRNFLKSLPEYIANIETLHNLVVKGDIENMKQIINKDKSSKLALCKDQSGVGLLHKAVYYDHQDIVNWLATKYPSTLSMKDKEGRTALHYCAACKDQHAVWEVLENAGADTTTVDNQGHNAEYYLQHPEQAELPEAPKSSGTMRRFTSGKDGFVVTRANIRIWIHDRDIGRLQQMLWEGHGDKLRVETSNNPRVKRFLDAVPYIMGVIKDVHGSVIRNDLPMLQKRTADPVPPTIFMSKDKNGLNPLHKAAGLGHADIVEYILEKNPKAATMTDNDGKLPLHYAAAVKDNGKIFNMLVDAGCDEKLQDNKGKFPAYYKMKPNEADPNSYLQVVPEAPRTASVFPPGWDWRLLNNMTYDFGPIGGVVQKHLFGKPDDLISEKSKTEDSAIDIQSEPEQNQENAYEEDNKDVNNENEENYPELVNKHMEGGLGDEDEGVGDDGEYPDRSDTQEDYHNDNEDSGNVDRWEREDTGEEKEAVDESESYDDENNTVNNEGYDDETGEQNRPETSIAGNEEGEEEGEENYSGLEKEGEAFDMRDDENNEQDEDGKINSEQNTEETDNMKDMTKAEVKNLVDTGNMEGLASLILNGQGEKLIGHTSDDPELQSFLSNVPAYMAKIQAVHAAAREGRLRDLQAALDRRKFAIARENASGVGATPLHVATLFGHTSIVRYLGGRFPETLHARDNKGRTPLHYAATIRDNGHYYNMLTTMGADHKLEDNDGRTAQYYRDNPNELTHQQLLEEYGASSSIASDTLEDKGLSRQQSLPQNELQTLLASQGQYLSGGEQDTSSTPPLNSEESEEAFGDTLVKGLKEVADKRPDDPVGYLATYLHNNANKSTDEDPPARNRQLAHQVTNPVELDDDNDTDGPRTADTPETAVSSANRDEHGQSMLHFAAARTHGRNALFQLLQETDINIGYRDELYRTARDVAIQANLPENVLEIDKWVLYLAARGETEKLVELMLEGYDTLLEVTDEEGHSIMDVVVERNQHDTQAFLQSLPQFEERREKVHAAIRNGNLQEVKELLTPEDGSSATLLAAGKNVYGRCSLHIAVLCQNEEITELIANKFPDTLRIGDNLERTALHYAMGVSKVEELSTILIKSGAKRVLKDLKGRQPTYYFMNRSDIARLQSDEEAMKS